MSPQSALGPVSAALEADLRSWVRRHGVVIWLDQGGHYTEFVDALMAARGAGALPYAVCAFRGSHLALMLALDGMAGGTEKVPLVVHLPGFTEETVRHTPLLELYEAGVRYRKRLDTLIGEASSGQVRQEQIAAFVAQPEVTLAGADAWLSALQAQNEGGPRALLRATTAEALLDDLLGGGFWAKALADSAHEAQLWEQWSVWTGLPEPWRHTTLPAQQPRAQDMAFAAASWALCVEYVDDLARPPVCPHLAPAVALPRSVRDTCHSLAMHLRDRHPAFYQRTADETEALLASEVAAAQAVDLGKIDTFRFEEDKVLRAALVALEKAEWDLAAKWAALRVDGTSKSGAPQAGSFWLRLDPTRQSAWQLVGDAARLGQTMVKAGPRLLPGPAAAGSLEAAVVAYEERGAAVDHAHRQLEQRRVALLYPQVPEFDALRARLSELRRRWREWADDWAREFNALCRAQGFLPPAALQQRTLFAQVVSPLTAEPGTTALFMVDALRFEMGAELYRLLENTPATTARLTARLAELPTVTEVGMNALAPVERNGRMWPVMTSDGTKMEGFQAGEFRVDNPKSRLRAMHERVGGATCPLLTLEEVVSRESAALGQTVARARLVVVHSEEIDRAGEKGVGPAVFDGVLHKLRAAWRLLRDAGVRRFVFTADHGFLLVDESSKEAKPHGRKVDPKRRHVFSPVAADHAGEARVALSALGYEGQALHVMFPEGTAVFETAQRVGNFIHGGNSLQERVIPVLTVIHRAASGGNAQQFGIAAEAREGVGGMHCLEVVVEARAQQALDFGTPKEVEVALRVQDVGDVQVELCQTRGKARLVGSVVAATVGARFELFFRLLGQNDARVKVELYHPTATADVAPCAPETWFVVAAAGPPPEEDAPVAMPTSEHWLSLLPEPARGVFAHLANHGAVREDEAAAMLGGPRGLRRFALEVEELAARAPFAVRIDVVDGVKRYVREGGA